MHIALDYDETYTRDPVFWDQFIALARRCGHWVCICTCRGPKDNEDMLYLPGVPVYFTDGAAKEGYMYLQGIRVDVWIDDCPAFIVGGIGPLGRSDL